MSNKRFRGSSKRKQNGKPVPRQARRFGRISELEKFLTQMQEELREFVIEIGQTLRRQGEALMMVEVLLQPLVEAHLGHPVSKESEEALQEYIEAVDAKRKERDVHTGEGEPSESDPEEGQDECE